MSNQSEPEMLETVAVYSAPDPISANLLIGVLAQEGISAALGEQVTGAYVGPFSVAEGYFGEVRVPAEHAERAAPIVEAFVAQLAGGEPPFSEADLAAQAEAAYDPNV